MNASRPAPAPVEYLWRNTGLNQMPVKQERSQLHVAASTIGGIFKFGRKAAMEVFAEQRVGKDFGFQVVFKLGLVGCEYQC
jgi:hypothetical protein